MLRYPHTYLNAVDPGRMLYGIALDGDGPRARRRSGLSCAPSRAG